jgi:hypothetical protein
MLPRRKRSHGPRLGVGLALLASILLISVGTPWSARAAEDNEAPKASVPDAPQVEDTDKPKDKSLLAHQPADTAKKSQAGDEAFYQKWQFWAITGAVVVGLVGVIYGGSKLYHSLNGGDVRPCNPMFVACFGQGEPNP